jgi:anthranilate phosphoribosyltransferase
MIKEAIAKLVAFQDITADEAAASMNEIMEGSATTAQIGAFLAAMRMKGETADEILGCARTMREKAEKVDLDRPAVDIVGTGGDGANTFNISTTAAFVAAAAGMPVAKHGNRSASSRCGSADVLERLGANITLMGSQAAECFRQAGLCFMFAPAYHKSMKHAAGPRKELGLRTIFNILGPLANPAAAQYQLLGVCDEKLVEPMTRVLAALGVKASMSVHGQDGLDEISISAPTTVCEARGGRMTGYIIHPGQFGITPAAQDDVRGGDAEDNAKILLAVLGGETGPRRDITLINAAAALYIGGKAGTLKEGLASAAQAVDSGEAMRKLELYKAVSNKLGEASA